MPRLLILLLGLFTMATRVELPPALLPHQNASSALRALSASGYLNDLKWPDFSDHLTQIQKFYSLNEYALAWSRDGITTDQAISFTDVFQTAEAKGLNPEDYDGSRWADRLAHLSRAGQRSSASELAHFDLALTVSVMRYISDIHFGRANLGWFHAGFDLQPRDLPEFVRSHLVNATNVTSVLDALEPQYEGYRRTRQLFQRYLLMAREDDSRPLPVTKNPIEPGDPYASVSQLATLLRRLGDLPAYATVDTNSTLYEEPLIDAVKRFQTRHGLEPDGLLGKATFAQLNTPLSRRVSQLRLALERWRWLPHAVARPPIIVNIPEFRLRALGDSSSAGIDMKVVVGKAYRHQTPVFAADMQYVVFRPYWNVPLSIQRAELVPNLIRDRSYLQKNGYEVVTAQNVVVSTGSVDEDSLAQLRSGKLQIRQVPGAKNSLGLVKFLFPNEHNVYLHATPAAQLFSRTRRDFSHGCIRLEKPAELAAWVLRNQPGWGPQQIHEAMNGTKTIQITLDTPVPVFIVYATAIIERNGEAHFFDDIYRQDSRLEEILAQGYPYHQ